MDTINLHSLYDLRNIVFFLSFTFTKQRLHQVRLCNIAKKDNLNNLLQHQDHGFDSQGMHELKKLFKPNAMQVALDKSICQLHKCKCIFFWNGFIG